MDFVDNNSFPIKVFKGHALVRLLVSFRSELSYGGCVNMSVMSSLIFMPTIEFPRGRGRVFSVRLVQMKITSLQISWLYSRLISVVLPSLSSSVRVHRRARDPDSECLVLLLLALW